MPININAGGVTIDLDLGLHKFTQQLRAARTMYTAAVKQMQIGAAQAQAILTRAQANAAQAPARQIANAAAQMVRAQANAQAQRVRATAQALAAQQRAQGAVNAQMVRAQGNVSAARIRAVGGIATGAIRALAAPINAVTRPLAAVVGAVTRLGGGGFGMGGLLGLGAGIGGGLSVVKLARDAMDMEKAVATLGRAAGVEGRDLETLGAKFKAFAATVSGVSTEHIFSLATFGAKLGISGPNLELFTRDMTKMGMVLADIPVEDAATRIVQLINVFRRGHDEAINFASALNALDLASTANARDILDVTRRLAPMMAFLGAKPTQAMALATALREANVPIETAGTSITQVLGRMLQQRHARDFAKVAGMDPKAFTRTATTDPLKALTAFIKGLSTMDKLQGVRALDKLALDGQRVRGTLLLLVPVLDKLNGFVKIAEDEWGSLNSIMKGSASVAATAWAQWERLKNNFTLTSAELGRGLLPAVKGLADGFVNLFSDIRHWAESNRAAMERWGKSIGDAFRYIGVLMREWRTFGRLGASFLTEAWEKATTVIGRIWDRLGDNIKTILGNVWETYVEAAPHVLDYTVALFEHYGPKIGEALAGGVSFAFKKMLGEWKGVFGAIPGFGGVAAAVAKMHGGLARPPGPPVAADFFKGFAPKIKPMPGFPGLMGNLPGRAGERVPMFGRLAGAVAQQRAANERALADQEDQDAAARARAADARRPPPRNRRERIQREIERQHALRQARMDAAHAAVQARADRALEARRQKFVDDARKRVKDTEIRFQNERARQRLAALHGGRKPADIPADVQAKIIAAEDAERQRRARAQKMIDDQKDRDAAKARARQAFAPGPVGQLFALAMMGGLPQKPMPSDREPRRERGAIMLEPRHRRRSTDLKAEAAFRAEIARINAANDFGVAPAPRKAGQGTFSPAAGSGQGAGRGMGTLNMLGDAWRVSIRMSDVLGTRLGTAIGEAMYRRTIEMNRQPIPGPQAQRAAPMSEATAIKMIASIEANTQAHNKLLHPGKMLGHWD